MKKILSTDKHRWTQINQGKKSKIKSRKYLCLSVFICGLISFGLIYSNINFQKVSAEEKQDEIENALFTHQEFFGAQAIVPFPTAQARENLAKLSENSPDNPEIIQKLAELDEKLEKFDAAEREYVHLTELKPERIDELAAFYRRRALFEKEAATLQRMFDTSAKDKKAEIFEQLLEAARLHDLKQYLEPAYFQKIAQENPEIYSIFEKLIDKLIEQKEYSEALKFIRQAKLNFVNKRNALLKKEVSVLTELNQIKETEKVYSDAFDVFWMDDESNDFYGFLDTHERLRAYGAELRAKFKQNPTDFDTAMRLAHYRKHNYDSITSVILQLEKTKKEWSTEELITVTRLLLQENEGELASRFLYTLHVRNELKPNSELRAKILYQLFKMFCEADTQRLSLTKGDLRFYEDVAKSDTNPGITTGILSLIFSDSKPGEKLAENEITATKFFNRAAAYRVFSAYKQEFPTSPELAQMYLDIVTIYTTAKETEIAQKTLAEFEQRYENSSDYAQVAIKLADAYVATKQAEKEREVLQKILDHLGKNGNPSAPKTDVTDTKENDSSKVDSAENIAIDSTENTSTENNYEPDKPRSNFKTSLGTETEKITYAEVLSRLVNSLAKEKQTDKILEIYSNEIQKYPAAEWLYEQRLSWLEQTNLVEEQLKVYKAALDKFQTRSWQDKLARWFIQNSRNDEFITFSTELVGKLNDEETANYLEQFIDSKVNGNKFDEQLYFKLYETAHQRFPHNTKFVSGLLAFYKAHKQMEDWRKLSAEYYFESKLVREEFLKNLAEKGELRNFLDKANEKRNGENIIYEMFRADACAQLSNYEEAIAAYRKLNEIYPNEYKFSNRLINFTRSLGQKNRDLLNESANAAHKNAEYLPSAADYRTTSGEIYAELGDYQKSREEWEKLIPTASGVAETYLDTATVYWDYYQYDDALRTIKNLREKVKNESLYAFETGAILDAQHKQAEAINEYVKALGKDESQSNKAKRRLKILSEKEDVFKQINKTVETQIRQRKDADWLALAYADFGENLQVSETTHSKQQKQSIKFITASVLEKAIPRSRDSEFLEAAKDFYNYTENETGKQNVLKRFAETTESPRKTISYRLQLAESYSDSNEKNQASSILANLVQKFPNNYGVLTESSDFYWRLGLTENAVQVLQTGVSRAKGDYQNNLAFRLSKRFVSLNRLDSAEKLLADLHAEKPTDTEIFHELASVYVREGKSDFLRKSFAETVSAIKKTDAEPREIEDQIADLRGQMIEAFTKLKDYNSAIEQHIEIINRDADDEEKTENAIQYVKRYGGAETLISYYQKTANEAYKNYRWNVVLARIYEAGKDWENAAKNYQTALIDQPEMIELYVSLADVETQRKNFDEALKNIDKVLELSNDEAQYVRIKIEILKKAGRTGEIEAEKAKLPVEEKPKDINQFAEARKLQATEKAKAIELYRQAFNTLFDNSLTQDFKAADITGYVQNVRDVEPLNQINEKLWLFRDKLVKKSEEPNSKNAGEARKRLQILDGAIVESVGDTARNFGTDKEIAALYEDFNKRIDESAKKTHSTNDLTILQNVSHRAGFGNLEEKILKIKLENTVDSDFRARLQNLLDFYRERGAYQKVLEVLEQKDKTNYTEIAETAKLTGEREKELAALRQIYQTPKDNFEEKANPFAARYLEILYAENREELRTLTEKSSVYQLQLINFLLGKGEKELSHQAIESANLSTAWKLARNAETSLALKEFDENSECYFCDALQINSIGEFIKQKPESAKHLIGNDWFKLSKSYGEWLYDSPMKIEKPSNYLTAMIENLPKDANEQAKLGQFYLEKKDAKNAIEHFRLALELKPNDKRISVNLGAAYYLAGEKEKAEEMWAQAIENEDVESCQIYLDTLQKYGLAQEAQYKLLPILVRILTNEKADNFRNLIRSLAQAFTTETAKTIYFQKVLAQVADDVLLPEMLVDESLVNENNKGEFYEMLINRSKKTNDSDYEFTAVQERLWMSENAEEIYTQDNNYKISEPANDRSKWEKQYLEYLLAHRQIIKAQQFITQIKIELKNHYARPAWLILGELRLQVFENKFNLSDAKQFIGIEIKADVSKINPPNIERFNDVLQMLKDEKHDAEANQLFESFFARMLAFEKYEPANFVGLARLYFQNGEIEKAVKLLQIMIDTSDSEKKETALAELDAMEIIKVNAVDKAKMADENTTAENDSTNDRLKIAAEISAECGQIETAITFRQQLFALAPEDTLNKLELARLFIKNDNKIEAVKVLTEINKDQNAARNLRWQAIWLLREMGENMEIKNLIFDSYSQFYNGLIAKEANQNTASNEFFINSLIADKTIENDVLQQLAITYAQTDQPFAALKIAESDKTPKSDELLNLLSETAEKVGDFSKAIEFEKAKTTVNEERINHLQELQNAKNKRITDFTVDLHNVR